MQPLIIPYIKAKNIAQIKARDANEVIAEMANDIQPGRSCSAATTSAATAN
ncbi:MAG: hypothetical protein MZV63_08940 [Marinilabiliales bacterium]|nr:hypothetical protein [Marinilabiliales bacterium]